MKASELRIGNLIINPNSGITFIEKVFNINSNAINEFYEQGGSVRLPLDYIQPIPLTEEWLLNAGFKEAYTANYIKDDIGIYLGDFTVTLEADDPYCSHNVSQKIQYVHQLQNLYFALKGEELQFKS
jgi:hypothetical protein